MSDENLPSMTKRIKRQNSLTIPPLNSDDAKINNFNQPNVDKNNASACENDQRSDRDEKVNSAKCHSHRSPKSKVSRKNKDLSLGSKLEEREREQHSPIPNHVIQSCVLDYICEEFSDDILQAIADYCSNKLTRVLKPAINNMKFASRTKFTIADFNRGLIINGEDVYETLPMEIRHYGTEKRQKCLLQEIQILGVDHLTVNYLWLKDFNPFNLELETLPNELNVYFNNVIKVLLVGDDDICSKVIKNLKSNHTILPLVPNFINFFISSINKLFHDNVRMLILLNALFALLSNFYLYFDPSLISNELISTILKILTADVHHSDHDFLYVIDISAKILSEILRRNESSKIFLGIVHDLKSVFSDFHKSFISHYGTVVALNAIGVPAIVIAILPHLKSYFRYLNTVSDPHKKHDMKMVEGQLIQTYYLLIHYYLKYEHNITYDLRVQHLLQLPYYYLEFLKDMDIFPFLSDLEFEEYFGDALAQHFPLLNFVSSNVNKQRNLREKISLTESSTEPCKSSVTNTKNNLSKKLTWEKLSLKNKAIDNKIFASSTRDAVQLHSKASLNQSTERIFDNILLKKPCIQFGKINL